MRQAILAVLLTAMVVFADFSDTLPPSLDNGAIQYFRRPPRDPVALLIERLQAGAAKLDYEPGTGFLRSLLHELQVPVESQVMVFSKTSLQAALISPANPRAIYFNDEVAVGWMAGGFIEIASQDPAQGTRFYVLPQQPDPQPQLGRNDTCLRCHIGEPSLSVPGWLSHSVFPGPEGEAFLLYGDIIPDHRTKYEDRWGGWYVTGATAGVRHMGNAWVTDRDNPRLGMTGVAIPSLQSQFDTTKYLSLHSDVAALLVFDHQVHMQNLLTRYGWEVRVAKQDDDRRLLRVIEDGAREVAEYMLFTHEQPLPGPMGGDSGFAKAFAARGPLRELDLKTRLLKHRLSYMVYSPSFDALPQEARDAIYRLLWEALSQRGEEGRSTVEILRATKPNLPAYFSAANVNAPSLDNMRRK